MIYEKTDNFFIQKINLKNITESRFEFLSKLCKDKKVLHVGCSDAMFFNPDNNLHIHLSKSTNELHGYDPDTESLNKLKKALPGIYFDNINQITDKYDIIIIPEVLEHVFNAKEFLDQMFNINSDEVFISVPNILHYSKDMNQEEDNYALEIVHPDHKYWFSPYTLFNITSPYIKNKEVNMFYLEHKSMVAIHLKK